ncbi:hypothetical protein ACFLUU_06100 [Chloroflexota bacterium]
MEITGIELLESYARYTAIFFIPIFVLITYSVGKRLKLAPNQCFLLSFMALSSTFFPYAAPVHPRVLATLLFLLLFTLLVIPRRTFADTLITIILFSVLVVTHGQVSIALLPGLILLDIYRKEPRFTALFLVIFGVWYIYSASGVLYLGLKAVNLPFANLQSMVQIERYQEPASTVRLIQRYSNISYLFSYAILITVSAILLFKRRINEQHRKQVISIFCWAIGVSSMVVFGLGEEAWRAFVLSIVPAATIIVLSFSGRKLVNTLMIALMCLFTILGLLSNYVGENRPTGNQQLTIELRGAEFFIDRVKPEREFARIGEKRDRPVMVNAYFYSYGWNNLMYYGRWKILSIPFDHPHSKAEADISELDLLHYVIMSKQGDEYTERMGSEPYNAWPQTETGRGANLLYNNGDFQIYENTDWESKYYQEWLRKGDE